jgi:hypothetical protein
MVARKSVRRMVLGLALLVFVWMCGAAGTNAQTQYSASLSGIVTDPSGAAVSGAKVTISSADRGFSHDYTTESNGLYLFSQLPPGVYDLDVEMTGFKHFKQAGITLSAGQTADQAVALVVGAVTEEVSVTAQAPQLNVENANIASDINSQQVVELPLNLRNVYGLAFLNSSVSNTAEFQVVGGNGISGSADQDISFFNFGGTFFNTAEYLLDGTWDTGADWGGVAYVPSVDGVEEFKIQTNAFTAQYGWSSGNVINVVTKSGSNGFHGDAFEFYRNSSLDARNYFNDGAQPDFHRNQYGATLGGPIQRNKTFFFAYYEGLRQATPVTLTTTVPTSDQLGGSFASQLGGSVGTDALGRPILAGAIYNPFSTRAITKGVIDPSTGLVAQASGYIRDPFANNVIPTGLMDTLAQGISNGKYWPSPTNNNVVNNFSASAAAAAQSDEYSIRIDHNFSDNDRINARWSQKFESKVNVPTYYGADDPAGPGATNPNNRYSFDLGYNHVFNPTFNVTANFGVNRWVENSNVQSFGFQPSSLGFPTFMDPISPLFPQIQPQGYAGLGPNQGLDDYIVPRTLWTSAVDFTKVLGSHILSFGFMDVFNQINGGHYFTSTFQFQTTSTAGPDPQNPTDGTGNSLASFDLGVGSGTDQTGYTAFPATSKHQLGWYLQDDWKVTRKLTVNLGLRYEVQLAPTARHNAQEYFDFNAVNPISSAIGFNVPGALVFNNGNNRGLYDTNYKNFAPRVGFAWNPFTNLVVRGGYGIFFPPSYYGQGPNIGYSQATEWITSLNGGLNPNTTLSNAFPNGQLPPTGNSLGGLTDVGQGLNPVVNNDRPATYVQQWMFGTQYQITGNDMVDVTYVGNHGVHVLAQYLEWDMLSPQQQQLGNQLNQMVANPFYGSITQASPCGLNNPTILYSQLIRPYPEYCSVTEAPPAVGGSTYNALEVTYNHRWKSGLDLNVSYTYSKFLDNVQGASGWAFPGSGSSVRDSYNLNAERSVDTSDIPNALVVYYIYQLPFGHGKPIGDGWGRATNAVLGGWQWTGIFTAKEGFPLSINPIANNSGTYGNQRPDLVSGVDPVPQGQNINNWINKAAFAQPAAFTYGDAPRTFSDLRSPHYVNWDTAIQKYWNFSDNMRLQFRCEMFNSLNHPNFFAPDTNLGDGNFGVITQAYPARSIQFGAKFYW